MGDGCSTDDTDLSSRLDGRAYSIVNAENAAADGQGVIGWYYPDEWDAFLQSTVTRQELDKSIPPARPGRISFLTLTNHFYSLATPLPQGKGMYPLLMSIPDVVGFDLYPLQVWCRPAFGDVMDAQRELHTTSGGKPTFQWIETAPMEHRCKEEKQLDPTPATVRAETWLAIAGGAAAIGYFPNRWSAPIGDEIARTDREIKGTEPGASRPGGERHVGCPGGAGVGEDPERRDLRHRRQHDRVDPPGEVHGRRHRRPLARRLRRRPGRRSRRPGLHRQLRPSRGRVYIIPPAGW